MKKIYTLFVALGTTLMMVAQADHSPNSFSIHEADLPSLEIENLESYDHQTLLAEGEKIEQESGRVRQGVVTFISMDPNNSGTWTHFTDGSKMWRLHAKTEGAKSVSVYFNDFHLPEGSTLHIYGPDRDYYVGPYTSEVNDDHGKFATDEVYGDEIILEYFEPADVIGTLALDTYGFAHNYNHVLDMSEDLSRGGSQPCEIDVNCPEGLDWRGPIDSVVKLIILDGGDSFLCSGALVNTTARDCRQYMLSALHCADGVSDSDLLLLKVQFNLEKSQCGSGGASTHQLTGVERLADSNDGGGNSGSDFVLFEIENDINENWKPFYAGWDVSGAGASSGVGIHHPSGDYKKISTYTTTLSTTGWGTFNSHWLVYWAETETDHGVTEGGSSGSPLFNPSHQIVGTLTGGGSFCNTPNEPDAYGKMSYHWTNNPNSSTQKLKVWLDPDDTDEEVLFGNYAPDCDEAWVGIEEERIVFSDIELYPNPSENFVEIKVDAKFDLEKIEIYNALGMIVKTIEVKSGISQVDISSMDSGIYYFTFYTRDNQQMTKKITKM